LSAAKFKVGDWVRILPAPPGAKRLKFHVSGDIGVIVHGPFENPQRTIGWPYYRLDISPGKTQWAGLHESCLERVPPPESELLDLCEVLIAS
jgi:hypothetical protein